MKIGEALDLADRLRVDERSVLRVEPWMLREGILVLAEAYRRLREGRHISALEKLTGRLEQALGELEGLNQEIYGLAASGLVPLRRLHGIAEELRKAVPPKEEK